MSEIHGLHPWHMDRLMVQEFNALVEYESKKAEAVKKAKANARQRTGR
jgi:hypothetical protein